MQKRHAVAFDPATRIEIWTPGAKDEGVKIHWRTGYKNWTFTVEAADVWMLPKEKMSIPGRLVKMSTAQKIPFSEPAIFTHAMNLWQFVLSSGALSGKKYGFYLNDPQWGIFTAILKELKPK